MLISPGLQAALCSDPVCWLREYHITGLFPVSQYCNSQLLKKKSDFVGCVHLLFNLMPVMCSVLFWYWMARPSLLLFALTLQAFSCPLPAGHSSALTHMTSSHGTSARAAALTTFNSLREMVTKGSLKQGQLNLISFLCSPKAETGSFRGCASSPKQLLWTYLQRSLPLIFSPAAVFHELGVIPFPGKGGWFAEY